MSLKFILTAKTHTVVSTVVPSFHKSFTHSRGIWIVLGLPPRTHGRWTVQKRVSFSSETFVQFRLHSALCVLWKSFTRSRHFNNSGSSETFANVLFGQERKYAAHTHRLFCAPFTHTLPLRSAGVIGKSNRCTEESVCVFSKNKITTANSFRDPPMHFREWEAGDAQGGGIRLPAASARTTSGRRRMHAEWQRGWGAPATWASNSEELLVS